MFEHAQGGWRKSDGFVMLLLARQYGNDCAPLEKSHNDTAHTLLCVVSKRLE